MAGLLRRAAAMAAPIGFASIMAAPAQAASSEINTADTAWMIVATALVLMMTIPGLALFYSGMVRKKNVLATMAQSLGGASGGLGGRPDAVLGLSCCLRSAGSCSSIAAWRAPAIGCPIQRSEEHTSELQSRGHLVCRLLLEKKKKKSKTLLFYEKKRKNIIIITE